MDIIEVSYLHTLNLNLQLAVIRELKINGSCFIGKKK